MLTAVSAIVLLTPEPPKTRLALGMRGVFDEVPDIVRFPGRVSASPTVNAIAAVAVLGFVDKSVIFEIVGGVLIATSVTVIPTVISVFCPLAVARNVALDEPDCVKEGVQVNVRVAGVNVAPVGSVGAEYVMASPSASVADTTNVRGDPSAMV